MHEYDLIADWYAADRNGEVGVPEISSLVALLPCGAKVLDIGCGNGIPLTTTLVAAGCEVVGVDSSTRMLERFRKNCPEATAIDAQIQSCDFCGAVFDAAIAWGVFVSEGSQDICDVRTGSSHRQDGAPRAPEDGEGRPHTASEVSACASYNQRSVV